MLMSTLALCTHFSEIQFVFFTLKKHLTVDKPRFSLDIYLRWLQGEVLGHLSGSN